MKRYCEITADESGRLLISFREISGKRWETYGHQCFDSPLPPAVARAYANGGPFPGTFIPRLRLVPHEVLR